MPLIKCPACGREVSTQAASCPNCGHPMPKSSAFGFPNANFKLPKHPIKGIVGLLLIIGIIMAYSNRNQSSNQTAEQNPTTPAKATTEATPPKPPTQADMCRSDWSKCADNEQLVNNY